jgi:hypothetical protein
MSLYGESLNFSWTDYSDVNGSSQPYRRQASGYFEVNLPYAVTALPDEDHLKIKNLTIYAVIFNVHRT